MYLRLTPFRFFFFNDTATTEIYTLSLHDALPILGDRSYRRHRLHFCAEGIFERFEQPSLQIDLTAVHLSPVQGDRKSTRLNSSHQIISYAVFCLKKKKKTYLLYCQSAD